jgi:hypothetical protein
MMRVTSTFGLESGGRGRVEGQLEDSGTALLTLNVQPDFSSELRMPKGCLHTVYTTVKNLLDAERMRVGLGSVADLEKSDTDSDSDEAG